MLAQRRKKYYIYITMLNLQISIPVFAVSLIASTLLLRKMFALRTAALRLSNLR